MGRMLNVGLGADTNPVAIGRRRAPRGASSRASAATRPRPASSTTSWRRKSPAWPTHEKVRAIGETGIDYYRETRRRRPSSGAPSRPRSRSPPSERLPIVIHARDPEGETGATDDVFEILDARADGRAGDPPLLPRPLAGARTRSSAAGTARSRGSSPSPSPTSCARPRRRCRTSWSWSRPTLPTWRRSRCAASRTSPPTWSPPREVVAEARGQSYEELERIVEANARALFGW